ncbi:MAG: ABC transporter permease [Cyclobacteriaceae bacterium]
MLKNYLLIAYRNSIKNKLHAGINIAGLSIGLACCIFIYLHVAEELSYDSFQAAGDRIYRVLRISSIDGTDNRVGVTAAQYGPALASDFEGQIRESCRVGLSEALLDYQGRRFVEEQFYLTDPNFLEMFSLELEKGNVQTALAKPNSLVLTQETAIKYFGDADPMGKTITLDTEKEFMVTGVLKQLPSKMHLEFDVLASMITYRESDWYDNFNGNWLQTYVLLEENADVADIEARLPAFMDKYISDNTEFPNRRMDIELQPLDEVYFASGIQYDIGIKHGNINFIYTLSAIGFFILLIACINFMNMATARATRRSREVGIRKSLGAMRSQLIGQFIGESVILTLVSLLLAIALVIMILPVFSNFLEESFSLTAQPWIIYLALLALIVLISMLTGLYPAFIISSFKPATALKGETRYSGGTLLRKGLVVFQFLISSALIVATLTVGQQLDFLQSKELGYEREQVIILPVSNHEVQEEKQRLKEKLLLQKEVAAVSLMSGEPGGFHDRQAFMIEGQDEPFPMRTVFTDHDYLKTLGVELLAGRDFSRDYGTDENEALIINKEAARFIGWSAEEAIGREIYVKDDNVYRQVVGVVENYHFASLHEKIEPLAITIGSYHRMMAVKLATTEVPAALTSLEKSWSEIAPSYPFAYNFLDQSYAELYKAEQKQGQLFSLFSGLAIFIACIGLFGLATFSAERRIKEIGIRKVLGASVPQLVRLVSKDFTMLVLIAFVLAAPLAYFLMEQWLASFAYRIAIPWWIFVAAGGFSLAIAWLTISYQSIKAATSNPAEAIRSE